MAVLRAVENRIPIVRCANTGISAFIDARGRILQITGLFEDATLLSPLQLGNGKTIYTHYGDWFAWGCVVVTLLLFVSSLKPRRGKEIGDGK
jgi:apolipoprotein N-acyltransferase